MWSTADTKPMDFESLAGRLGCDSTSVALAKHLDSADPLAHLRRQFHVPTLGTIHGADESVYEGDADTAAIYMCGNSLGLLPKKARHYVDEELHKWADHGVHGHFIGARPWAHCDETAAASSARLVGAHTDEVALMNGLSVNLHLMMISFYRPTATRYKLVIESGAFPSDDYAAQSQLRLHGLSAEEGALIRVRPREGEETLRTADIVELLHREGDKVALVLLSAVQYYTGQYFEVEEITKAAHDIGAICGWDLAHAVGNVPLQLHRWQVDFAAWCSYKYVNSGAGGLAAAFVHRRHHGRDDLHRLCGWWSNRAETRFHMSRELDLGEGASAWRISNPPILLVCALAASLEIFDQTSMADLRAKSVQLTGYLEHLVVTLLGERSARRRTAAHCRVVTPGDAAQRGAQLSLRFSCDLHGVHEELVRRGVACDKRLPHVLRAAPAPLYTRFEDVHRFAEALCLCVDAAQAQARTDDGGGAV